MNISRDPNKLTSVLNFDIKSSKLDVQKTHEAPAVSFGEILKKEADSFVNQFESPKIQENKPQAPESNHQQTNVSVIEKKEETSKISTLESSAKVEDDTEKTENVESDDEMETELELDDQDLNFFAAIQPFQQLPTSESKLNKEDAQKVERPIPHLALLKNNEKHTPYVQSTKESTNFIDDAKKLAESIFKKDKKENKGKDIEIPIESKNNSEKSSVFKEESSQFKTIFQKENVTFAHFNRQKETPKPMEKTGQGSSLPSSVSAQGKEVVKKEMEVTQIVTHQTKDNQLSFSKENLNLKDTSIKKKPSNASLEGSEDKKNVNDVQVLSDKMTRNLGVKDKEFSKSEIKNGSSAEKFKSKEQVEAIAPVNISSVQGKDESGQLSNGNKNPSSNRDGFSFSSEMKLQTRSEELSKSEKTNLPSRQEIQKNMDELVKQARFDIVQNGKSTAEIIMNPKEFGRLTLRVSVDGEKVEGRILVESEEMKELVSNEISKLRENLKDSGLSLESLLVDVWENANSNLSQNASDERKLAEEMIKASSNRSSIIEAEEEGTQETNGSRLRTNALEVFA